MAWEEHFLHDAGLSGIEIDWEQRRAVIHLVPHGAYSEQPKAIKIRGLRQVTAARYEPWGPSDAILATEGPSAPDGGGRLVLHMQSGDDVVVVADEFSTEG